MRPWGARDYVSEMSSAPIPSPCIKVCAVSGRTGFCIGCGRTLAEIAAWGDLSDAERQAILTKLPGRRAAAEEVGS